MPGSVRLLRVTPKLFANGNTGNNSAAIPMQIFRDIRPLRDFRRQLLLQQKSVGLVPTMGALHAGHLSLVRRAAQENTDVVVSIYVNPLQFGVNEDLDTYPRTWDKDLKMLMEVDQEFAETNTRMAKCSVNITGKDTEGSRTGLTASPLISRPLGRISAVFAPNTKTMYPTLLPTSGNGTFVTVTPLASLLEGASRPIFFRGVATVCMKLFNIVTPDKVYFGQKDVQQTVIIKRMVKDLCVPTEVIVGPTMREDDGLAMSSRNIYLGQRRRPKASVLVRTLKVAEEQYMGGKLTRDDILGPALRLLGSIAEEQEQLVAEQRVRFEVDYISLADIESLDEIGTVDETKGAILSGAVKMLPIENPQEGEDDGKAPVRLIDNIILKPMR